jgi:hypothetical protein
MQPQEGTALSFDQQAMSDLWDEHMRSEFETSSVEATLETMVEDPYVNHVSVMTGGVGLDEVRTFYAERFITQQPPEVEITPVSRTVGNDRVVDELIYAFTHDIVMDWMMPGLPPDRKAYRDANGRRSRVQGRQDSQRAHLLGSGHGAHASRSDRRGKAAHQRCRERQKNPRPRFRAFQRPAAPLARFATGPFANRPTTVSRVPRLQ